MGPDIHDTYVGFTAKLSEHATNLGLNQPVIFDNVHTNVGNAYSRDTGVFTAPVNGTYYFISTIMCHPGDFLEAEMVHNGNHVVFLYAYDSGFEQGVNGAVLVLSQGDHVWIRIAHEDADKVYGRDWSAFSGFLLFSDTMKLN